MAVQVKCAKYDGDPRVIDKQPTLIDTLLCKITDPMEVMNPSLILTKTDNIKECNYFVIGFRKYFKTKEINMSNNMVEIRLHEDVLSTWLPKVKVKGVISVASEAVSLNANLGYFTDVNNKVSRIAFNNNYVDFQGDPLLVVQTPTGIRREDSWPT